MSLIPPEMCARASTDQPSVEWEETACLLCGSRHSSLLLEAPDFQPGTAGLRFAVVQCHDCGLCFTNPRPSQASMAQFYPPLYRPHHPRSALRRRATPAFLKWSRNERKTLPWHGQGRLLDFGCGNGSYLERMTKQGWQVTGLDTSPSAVARVRRGLGLHVLHGSLPHPQLRPGSFDVITMWQSLEHVHEPMQVLRQAHALLVPGGRLLVAAPNIDSLPFRWFGAAWFALDLPRHLIHFTPPTLTSMLERAGFRPHSVRMVRHSDWLRSSAQRALGLANPAHPEQWCRWLSRKPLSRLATWYGSLTGQADSMLVLADK
jgi:2-polyprenyl-3-methyl-5-hydroxy-6-metoxy-1,4-benzoquinol methylase